jgi:hypothetical protein
MSVPDVDLVCTGGKETADSCVDFADQQSPHLSIGGIRLLLAADSSHTLCVGD